MPQPEGRRTTISTLHILACGGGQVLRRCFWRIYQDRLLGEAAAVAFYALLAIFPALAALVTLCGLFVDPEVAARYFQDLAGPLPTGAADVARDALGRIGTAGGGRIGLAAGLAATALWSATVAVTQLFAALNVAYRQTETRGVLRLCGTGVLFAIGAMVFVMLALGGVLGVSVALGIRAGSGGGVDRMLQFLRWPVLLALASVAFAFTYRHGPCHARPRWHWSVWASVAASSVWLLGSASVSWYIQRVGSYDWLYGSVGGVLGLMLWAWVSSAAVLAGAVLDAELEQQSRPSTDGALPYP
ncbi:YihY/virulence factor BrkB family protein [Teichococcus wenyumeiae]|uniref:YihY/virulence factor BrkB family protein n=1 Tax=Teichococcus wenyumeiae TaxID=2478470 RepID=UPI001314DEFA|nr:YihY/virulence factor BrkB family protein [Pseudoroseomonas wenyumeiae]